MEILMSATIQKRLPTRKSKPADSRHKDAALVNGNGHTANKQQLTKPNGNKFTPSFNEQTVKKTSVSQTPDQRRRGFRFVDFADDERESPLERIRQLLKNVSSCGDGFSARCPAHADENNSLTFKTDETGKVLIHCHAGCSVANVMNGLGLDMSALFPADNRTHNPEHDIPATTPTRSPTTVKLSTPTTGTKSTCSVGVEPKPFMALPKKFAGAEIAERLTHEADDPVVEMLAGELGVTAESLRKLQVGWNERGKSYTFPERNAKGEITGITSRLADGGAKRTFKGSKRGLTFATDWAEAEGPLPIVEGASDTAAGLTMGMAVIGRPSATGGSRHLAELLNDFPEDREILVVGEMDAKDDGSWPGRDAAKDMATSLATALGRSVKWCLPPKKAKDLRAWLAQQENQDVPADLREEFLAGVKINEAKASCEPLKLIDSRTFATAKFEQTWLIKGIMVAGQPAVVGGPKKSLKTSLLVDLAVSLGTGCKFLGEFSVERKRVGVISGESGERTLQETYLRIRNSRSKNCGDDPAKDNILWGFNLPRLGEAAGLAALDTTIRAHGLEVIILDPLYLSLLSGRPDVQASNLFQMGPLLAEAARVCLEAGATPIFVHHNVKQKNPTFQLPELEDLAFAGIQEFARQWILLGRREQYKPGSGNHSLWLTAGGSAGFSGCWALDIYEGTVNHEFSGRTWLVEVRPYAEELQLNDEKKAKDKQQAAKAQLTDDMEEIKKVLQNRPAGETKNLLEQAATLPRKRLSGAIENLLVQGVIEETQVQKLAGQSGCRSYPGYRLVSQVHAPDEDQKETEDNDTE
jgi:replicative DNA helicase